MHFYAPTYRGDAGTVLAGLEMVHTARFPATPECAAFVPRGDGDGDGAGWELVVGLRDTAHLVYVDCSAAASSSSSASGLPSFAQRTVSLNEADWDTHVSFTPLALAPSPDRRHLLVATDQVGAKLSVLCVLISRLCTVASQAFHFVVAVGQSRRLRVLAGGHACGPYGKPRVAWDPRCASRMM